MENLFVYAVRTLWISGICPFILYTNKLANIDIGALDLEMLSQIKLSTSTVEEDNMLEYVYGLVKNSAYSTYESNLIATLEAGQTYTYYKSVYKDLLK